MVNDTYAMRIRQAQRSYEITPMLDPVRTGHLTVTVEGMEACPYGLRLGGVTTRQDGSYASLYLPVTGHEIQRAVTDADTGNIGDGIVGARYARDRQAEVARAGLAMGIIQRGSGLAIAQIQAKSGNDQRCK